MRLTRCAQTSVLSMSVVLVLPVGCASYHGYPARYSDVSKDLAGLQDNFKQEKVTECEGQKTTSCRDLIVNSLVQAIDIQYDGFRQQLFRSSGGLSLTKLATLRSSA